MRVFVLPDSKALNYGGATKLPLISVHIVMHHIMHHHIYRLFDISINCFIKQETSFTLAGLGCSKLKMCYFNTGL